MITTKEAAEVAKKHGLTLTDAAALSRLADTTEEADELAGLFADPVDGGARRANDSIRQKAGAKRPAQGEHLNSYIRRRAGR